jgi:formyl-CoA transferase
MKPTVTASPLLGEHTDEVLAEFGLDAEEISNLRRTGTIG